jgi:hypothetical protein
MMTERTAEVSGEAKQTRQHGPDVREDATGLNADCVHSHAECRVRRW